MGTQKTALIVDDEQSVRYYFKTVLEMNGFECAEAQCGEEALSMLDEATFDVMTLDVRMPGMGGLDVLREVRNRDTTLPIVMVTALGDPEIASRALTESGANGFLGKPCTVSELISAIGRICDAT